MTGENPTIRDLLRQAATLLPGESARLDAEVLLAACLGKPRSHLHAWPEAQLQQQQLALYRQLVAQRARGEPVACCCWPWPPGRPLWSPGMR